MNIPTIKPITKQEKNVIGTERTKCNICKAYTNLTHWQLINSWNSKAICKKCSNT